MIKISLRERFLISYLALVGITLIVFTGVLEYQLGEHAARFARQLDIQIDSQTVIIDGQEKRPPMFKKEVEDSVVWTGAGVSILAIILSAGMAGYLSRPIQKLTAAARTLAKNQYAEPIDVHSKDELGELAAAFNSMSTAIHEHEYIQKQLVTNLAHELGTPLTSLSGYLEALKDGLIPEEKRARTYDILSMELDRLRSMLEDVRTLALTQEKHLVLNKEKQSIQALMVGIVDSIKPQFESKKIELKIEPKTEDFMVIVDRNRFTQIVLNLLQNALKYSPEKTQVKLGLSSTEKEWSLRVTDQGEGIPENEIRYIFDRFYRVDKSRARSSGVVTGQGIGLAVVKSLTQAHGGSITVKSTVGQGSTFTLTFPKPKS